MTVARDQVWFEMTELRRRSLDTAVWIPLRAIQTVTRLRRYGELGHEEEFFGAASLAVPVDRRDAAEKLGWGHLDTNRSHRSYVDDGTYVPADVAKHADVEGLRLLVEQRGNSAEQRQWHLHPDLVVALYLKQEGDEWLAIDEGYTVVAKLQRSEDGAPELLMIRGEHLKDYLCARGMGLCVNTFRKRAQVIENADHIKWAEEGIEEVTGHDRWRGDAYDIHEGGTPFGTETAVFHVARTDVDLGEDVPVMGPPTDQGMRSSNWTTKSSGKKLVYVRGELWRTEWVAPGPSSPRVREDEQPSALTYLVDSSGKRLSAGELLDDNYDREGRWLWFKPHAIVALADRRGGSLQWYTRDTGDVRCSPDYRIHFGMNDVGMVNVYAKDIAQLPEWQQQVWAGFNVGPEGGVSRELLASQVEAEPAATYAPEEILRDMLKAVNEMALDRVGIRVFRDHAETTNLIGKVHRFRALDDSGLYALAKDIARLTADSIDASALQSVVPLKKGEKRGSLKSLEAFVAAYVGPEGARAIVGPLFGAYELRLADAHLPGDVKPSLELLRIDAASPPVIRGKQLIQACADSLVAIGLILKDVSPQGKSATEA